MNTTQTDPTLYHWRNLSRQQQQELLDARRKQDLPWHSPPHYESSSQLYIVTAACYEHRHYLSIVPDRLAEFETMLVQSVQNHAESLFAWVLLPNHYHLIVHAPKVKRLLHELGQLHGRTSFQWNGEDGRRGRKLWYRAAETAIKSDRHFYAAMNYVLHNAVRHGYVVRWQDWPYSNAKQYLHEVGRREAERRWREYPVLDFGKDWDPPEL